MQERERERAKERDGGKLVNGCVGADERTEKRGGTRPLEKGNVAIRRKMLDETETRVSEARRGRE